LGRGGGGKIRKSTCGKRDSVKGDMYDCHCTPGDVDGPGTGNLLKTKKSPLRRGGEGFRQKTKGKKKEGIPVKNMFSGEANITSIRKHVCVREEKKGKKKKATEETNTLRIFNVLDKAVVLDGKPEG